MRIETHELALWSCDAIVGRMLDVPIVVLLGLGLWESLCFVGHDPG
jgi:hypothetical protein